MAEYEIVRCDRHGIDVPEITKSYADANGLPYGCSGCRTDLEQAPDPLTMTRQERADELRTLMGEGMYASFDAIWQRVDILVGRGTYTHELAYPEYLEHEILTGNVPTTEGIIAKLPHDMPVIIVTTDD